MARTAGKKQAPAKVEEDDDAEGWEDAVVEAEGKEEADLRLRDWRDVERFRELKELRRLVDDDYGLEEIFHIPLKPRPEPGIPARAKTLAKPLPSGARGGAPARAATAPAKASIPARHAAPAKTAPAPAKASRPHAKTAARPAPKKKPPAKLKAKAKRR